jgi:hypothetical protein
MAQVLISLVKAKIYLPAPGMMERRERVIEGERGNIIIYLASWYYNGSEEKVRDYRSHRFLNFFYF